jgi:hypothetical protein
VQDLIIDAPDGGVALSTFGDVGSPVIRAASGAQGATGLVLYGSSTATSANIQMDDNGQPANRGLDIAESVGNWAGDATISGSVIDSMDGVNASNGFSLKTTVLVTGQRGIDVLCAGSADIDTVVHTVTGGYGLRATSSTQCGPADPAIVDVRHLTLVAENAFAGPALRVFANQNGLARITVRSSIVLGFESVVEKVVDTVPGTKAELKVGYSLADLTLITPQSNDGPATNLGGNFVADPLFSDAPARDYGQRWPSPTIDAGHPLPLAAGESLTAFNGPRLVDGNGDGTARRDAGAYEYNGPAPRVTASPNPVVVGEPVTFDASGTTFHVGPIRFAWSWDDGGSAGNSATATHAFSTPGTHTGTVTVTDNGGQAAPQPFSVVVNAAPAGEQPGGPGTPANPSAPPVPSVPPSATAADTAAPSFTAKLLKKRFKRKKGGTLQLRLSEPATVSVLVERCTKHKGRRCTRYKRASSKSLQSPAGTSRIALKGLRTGLHRVRVQATDGAGNRSPERTAAFTVTR